MPPFDQDGPPLSFFEFGPMWAFYPPVALYAAWLMLLYRGVPLPTVANPSFPGGGFVGESKAEILALAMRQLPQWVAPFVTVDRAAAPGKLYLNYNASVQETWLKDPAGYIKLADAKFAALFKKRAPHPPAGDDS
jgi:hypothetical protein